MPGNFRLSRAHGRASYLRGQPGGVQSSTAPLRYLTCRCALLVVAFYLPLSILSASLSSNFHVRGPSRARGEGAEHMRAVRVKAYRDASC
eukprot:763068-Hanusia_phi.AAC.5